MALGNFFDKAALAASHILHGYDYTSFATRLEAHTVGVAFDATAMRSPEAKITLDLAVNLLARLYPRIALRSLDEDADVLVNTLTEYARTINPAIDVESELDRSTVCMIVGETRVTVVERVLYIGSSGWLAKFSRQEPVGSGTTANPFGAGAAACIGAANVFRMLFHDQLVNASVDAAFTLSLLDYTVNEPSPLNPSLAPIELGECHLVGLGAIGNGALWAWRRTPGLSGVVHGVDDEIIGMTNLQR